MKMVQIHDRHIPITGDNAEAAIGSYLFKDWVSRISPKFDIQAIEFQSVDFTKDGRVFFAKLKADVLDSEGRPVSGIVFLRGGSVAILVALHCENDTFVVLVNQPRFAMGNAPYTEIPAGMLDEDGDFSGVAAKELEEELGIMIEKSELVDLMDEVKNTTGHPGIYPSPGACDEFIRLMLFEKKVSFEELVSFRGKITGSHSEHERIALSIIPIWRIPRELSDGKSLAAYCLYQTLMEDRTHP